MLTTIGVAAACAASLIASTNAWSGVGPEVHHLRRAGGHGDDHLDVEEHLSVGADRVRAGSVGRAVHSGGRDRRHRKAAAGKIGLRVAGGKTTPNSRMAIVWPVPSVPAGNW